MTTHRITLLQQGIFDQKQHYSRPPPPTFLFPRLKIKLKCRHLDTTEVIEEESQAVLNTLTERDFQKAFEKWQKRWERCTYADED
jgi:hypothetical protein